jgi:adenylate cyclase
LLDLRFVHGQEQNALPAAERALEINPKLAEAHCVKARFVEEEGHAEEAQHQMRTALKLDPESWEVNRETARMLFRHGRIADAIPFFEKGASLMDSDWSNPMMLITCYDSIGDKDKMRTAAQTALERVERALAKDPTNGTAMAVGAYSLAMFGDRERAREWIRRALLFDAENLNMRYNLACTIVRQLDDIDEALETLRPFFEDVNSTTLMRHLEVDPDLDPIRQTPRFKEMLAAAKKRLGMTGDGTAAE